MKRRQKADGRWQKVRKRGREKGKRQKILSY